MPHDVIANARKLVAFVIGYPTDEPALSYAEAILSELSELIPVAQQDANAAKASLVTQQELQKASREAAAEFYRQVLLFRRVLRRLLGSSHRDCQLLHVERANSATRDAEEQVAVVEVTEEAGDAEPPSTGAPTAGSNTTPVRNGSPTLLNAPRA